MLVTVVVCPCVFLMRSNQRCELVLCVCVFFFYEQRSQGVSSGWIGISDVSNHEVMSWLDGTPSNYINFDLIQHPSQGRKCGVIFTNLNWQSKPCDGARGFVCKRPLRGKWTSEPPKDHDESDNYLFHTY